MEQLQDDKTYSNHETNIQEYWKQINIYNLLDKKEDYESLFRFIDGPPFCSSNTLHFGHLLQSYVKNTVLQYQHMHNKKTLNKLGFDTHGLPVEQAVNKQIGINTRPDIISYGIDKYNGQCKDFVHSCSKSWEPIFNRIGRICDYNNSYKTLDTTYMESEWWVFKQLWEKNLIYKGYKIMPFSTACETPLSNFEASDNYKEIKSKSVYVNFKVKNQENTFLMAWTTTPWTLPSNLTLCVNPEVEYVKVSDDNKKYYIVSKECVNNLKLNIKNIISLGKGINLNGLEYEPLFDYMNRNKFVVITDKFVEGNSKVGTGIVHLAPAFGMEDYEACIKNKIIESSQVGNFCPVDDQGKYTKQIYDMEGLYVFDANDEIIRKLKKMGLHFRTESYSHNYPFCYRTDTPLMYKAVSSYFVKTTALKDKMLKNNEKINWFPKVAGDRHKLWLEHIQDWGISRQRFFGTPIPVWLSNDGLEVVVIGSIDELVEKAKLKERPTDLHKEFIEQIVIPSKKNDGSVLRFCGDVLDCWFDSACVPFGQIHYPFENKEILENNFEHLSDFVCEGADQVKLWFYVLNVMSTAIFNKPAFKNVICTGMIYDEYGLKFSKKYGNFKNPIDVLEKYGSDSLRLYLLNSPLINSNSINFDENNIKEVKQKLIPYINSVKFFITQFTDFINKNNEFDINAYKQSNILTDKWIISRLGTVIKYIENKMNVFMLDKCIQELFNFIEDLTNWYIKFNRDRLRGLSGKEEWKTALSTLYHVLYNFIKIMAPFTPFLSEYLYNYMKILDNNNYKSVLLCEYSKLINFEYNELIEAKMQRLKQVVKLVRNLRDKSDNLKTIRIPLKKIIIYHNDENYLNDIRTIEDLAQEEINCDKFEYEKFSNNIKYELIPNLKSLGTTYKSKVNLIIQNLKNINMLEVEQFANNLVDNLNLKINNELFVLNKNDVSIKVIPINNDNKLLNEVENDLMVAIDTTFDEESQNNYQMRLMLREVQKLRRENGLNPWNKINICFKSNYDTLNNLFQKNKDLIENKLKCSIKIDNIPNNIFAQTNYVWKNIKDEEYNISLFIEMI